MVTAINSALLCLLIISPLLGGCSSTQSSWQCAMVPSSPCKKLSLPPKNAFQNLEIVLHKEKDETRAIINVYGIPLKTDGKTQITLTLDGQRTYYAATVLEGGQRIILPSEAEAKLLDALYQKKPLVLAAGRYCTEVNYEGFEEPLSLFQNDTTSSFFL